MKWSLMQAYNKVFKKSTTKVWRLYIKEDTMVTDSRTAAEGSEIVK
jgi:hypothetical protein